jgi:hypothetical protein
MRDRLATTAPERSASVLGRLGGIALFESTFFLRRGPLPRTVHLVVKHDGITLRRTHKLLHRAQGRRDPHSGRKARGRNAAGDEGGGAAAAASRHPQIRPVCPIVARHDYGKTRAQGPRHHPRPIFEGKARAAVGSISKGVSILQYGDPVSGWSQSYSLTLSQLTRGVKPELWVGVNGLQRIS